MDKKLYRKYLALLMILTMCIFKVSVSADDEIVPDENEEDTLVINNGIPVVYLNIDETKGTIDAMNSSTDHSVYCYGTFTIDVPDDFHYVDYPDSVLSDLNNLEMSIRGRGNSTWRADKKPYKIKLDKKTDVLGLGKNKHWVLIANASDPTLMKDRMTALIADKLGFAFTPRGVPVDLVMSGQDFGTKYLGSYYLSENVRVDDNRVNIKELDEDDSDPEVITGGYLLQNASQLRDGSPDRFLTDRGVDWGTETPSFEDYENTAQQEYIQSYMQMVEDILFNGTKEYRDYFDYVNAARYWLVNEIPLNNDAYGTGSTYIYKDRDQDGSISKLYWGPVWDFDLAWTHNRHYDGFEAGHEWMKPFFCDPDFVKAVKDNWKGMEAILEELIAKDGLIDKYAAEVRASALCDHEALNPSGDFEYDKAISELKDWIRNRINWVNENINQLDELVHQVTFIADGKVYAYDYLEKNETVNGREPHPKKEGYTFVGWENEQGDLIEEDIPVTRNMTLTARYVGDDTLSHATDIAFSRASDVVRISPMAKTYRIRYVILPEDAQDQNIKWTTSNQNIAGISDDGLVRFYGPGVVTFTAELEKGASRTFTLTILEAGSDPLPYPEKIYPEKESIEMKPGEQSPFIIEAEPFMSKISSYEYESEDPQIVEVGEYGVLTAKAEGTTRVYVEAKAYDEEGEAVYLKTFVTVNVSNKKPTPAPGPVPGPAPQSKTETEKEKVYRLPLTGIE